MELGTPAARPPPQRHENSSRNPGTTCGRWPNRTRGLSRTTHRPALEAECRASPPSAAGRRGEGPLQLLWAARQKAGGTPTIRVRAFVSRHRMFSNLYCEWAGSYATPRTGDNNKAGRFGARNPAVSSSAACPRVFPGRCNSLGPQWAGARPVGRKWCHNSALSFARVEHARARRSTYNTVCVDEYACCGARTRRLPRIPVDRGAVSHLLRATYTPATEAAEPRLQAVLSKAAAGLADICGRSRSRGSYRRHWGASRRGARGFLRLGSPPRTRH